MHIGVFSYNTEYTMAADELALACEERGYESLWLPEHTHIPASRESPFPGGGELPKEYVHMSDPFIGLAAAAAVTQTLKLGTGISLVTEHDPIVQAKQIASLDRLSHGRFLFGIGAGWNKEEMRNHGTPPNRRWTVLTERVEAMQALWTQDEASYHGEFVNFDRVWSYPKPLTRPHPPILLGSLSSKIALKRVVDLCDGWIPVAAAVEDLPGSIAKMHEYAESIGRDPQSIPITCFCTNAPKAHILERFQRYGAVRTVVRIPTEDRGRVYAFLDTYAPMLQRFA